MTINQIDDLIEDQEVKSEELRSTVGPILRAARKKSVLSIEQVAQQLNLRPSLVERLEKDDFSTLSSATYTRGYVRSYARLVGADEELVMSCLEHQVPSEAEPAMQSFSRKMTHKASDGRLTLITYVIVFLLLSLLVVWWVQKSSNDNVDVSKPSIEEVVAAKQLPADNPAELPTINNQPDTSKVANTFDNNATIAATATNPSATNVSATNAVVSDSTLNNRPVDSNVANSQETNLNQVQSQTRVSAGNVAPSVENESTNEGVIAHLTFNLNGESWLKVDDASGKTLVHGVKKAGQIINVDGVEPINLVIGAPQAVKLKYNGQNIDLAAYPSGRVARFSLPRS